MRSDSGLTVTEGLVALGIFFALWFLLNFAAMSNPTPSLRGGQMLQTLSNMRQLHLATQSAALDGKTTGDTNLGWPGDLGGTFTNWVGQVTPVYLGTNDLCKLLSAPGFALPANHLPTRNTNAVLVYAVRETSGSNTVFLTTANFTNTVTGGLAPMAKSRPYGTNGFVVMRKDGQGQVLSNSSVGNTNKVGAFVPLCQ